MSDAPQGLGDAWIIQRQQGSEWLWWAPDAGGYTADLIHAGIYTKAQAQSHNRLRHPGNNPHAFDHKAIPLREALGLVKLGSLGALLGLPGIPE